jgi:hypothetical protein
MKMGRHKDELAIRASIEIQAAFITDAATGIRQSSRSSDLHLKMHGLIADYRCHE